MPSSSSLHPETVTAVRELRERYPDTPFLTLGQTVFWDEPVKAALCRVFEILEGEGTIAKGTQMVAGVHDTDYFAKLEGLTIRDTPFVVLRHNDGDTHGLWSAAGEISALFGAEVVPSRQDFTRQNVALGKAARAYFGGQESLLNQETEAPLWRALVHTEERPIIAAEVKLGEIAPALRQQLRWAFRSSLESSGCEPDFENEEGDDCHARAAVRALWNWVNEFLEAQPEASLSDLYRDLIPRLWALMNGGPVCNLSTTASLDLFRFAPETCQLPRFRFLDLFLNPATRSLAKRCYNDAVRGSGIYALDQFGEGALPFDVVISGIGRGTLRVFGDTVSIETEPETQLCEQCHIESVAQLAALLKSRYGDGVALVGKAVALISMLSAEFIFAFHEKASAYTSRTQKMNDAIRAQGVELPLHPMLRVKLGAWDALEEVEAHFTLPSHLSKAFKTSTISARDFAQRWQGVADQGDTTRTQLKAAHTSRELMEVLAQLSGAEWREREQAYVGALGALQMMHRRAETVAREVASLRNEAKASTESAIRLEREKGGWFRHHIAPLRAQIFDLHEAAANRLNPTDENGKPRKLTKDERAAQAELERSETAQIEALHQQIAVFKVQHRDFDSQIEAARAQARELRSRAKERLHEQLQIEQSSEAQTARQTRNHLEERAELARLCLVRDAMMATDSLHYTNYRPTAWWFPLVSPDGKWFSTLAQTAKARIEEL
ncbi:hypothetical protein IAD21_05251 [Abditibacteriota bacterium]|nr:hypothetical protein IAD21_05251 [Abditibacteriota bacterium]